MSEQRTVISARVHETVKDALEALSKQTGKSKSSLLEQLVLDKLANLERSRHCSTLADFLDLSAPVADFSKEQLEKLFDFHTRYVKERLQSKITTESHLCTIASDCFVQGYTEAIATDTEGFLVQNALQQIYDTANTLNIISPERYEERLSEYTLYMQEQTLTKKG
jgi:hypothetical protein